MIAVETRSAFAISEQSRRLIRACLIVSAVIVIPAIAAEFNRSINDVNLLPTNEAQVLEEEAFETASGRYDLNKILAAIDKRANEGVLCDAVPEPLSSEIGVLEHGYEMRVSADGNVMGYLMRGEANTVADCLKAHMEGKGWNAVSLGGVAGDTFVKIGGLCTWALATCTQVGDEVSVVIRLKGQSE